MPIARVYCPYTYTAHELLADGPLWQVAKSLHELIRSVEPLQMEMTNRWVAAQPDKSRIRLDYSFVNGSFTVSQWAKFGMYLGVGFDADGHGQAIPPSEPVWAILGQDMRFQGYESGA